MLRITSPAPVVHGIAEVAGSCGYSAVVGSVTVPGMVMAVTAAHWRYAAGSPPRSWAVSIIE